MRKKQRDVVKQLKMMMMMMRFIHSFIFLDRHILVIMMVVCVWVDITTRKKIWKLDYETATTTKKKPKCKTDNKKKKKQNQK